MTKPPFTPGFTGVSISPDAPAPPQHYLQQMNEKHVSMGLQVLKENVQEHPGTAVVHLKHRHVNIEEGTCVFEERKKSRRVIMKTTCFLFNFIIDTQK